MSANVTCVLQEGFEVPPHIETCPINLACSLQAYWQLGGRSLPLCHTSRYILIAEGASEPVSNPSWRLFYCEVPVNIRCGRVRLVYTGEPFSPPSA